MDINKVKKLTESADSFYVYDSCGISANARRLRNAFPTAEFLYSVKCNPHPEILKIIAAEGFGADCASAAEVGLAEEAGIEMDRILFSAPGQRETDIAATLGRCIFTADSLRALEIAAAASPDVRPQVALRINPDFGFDSKTASASKFGIDEEKVTEDIARRFGITGIHVHLKSQELDAEKIAAYYEKMFDFTERFCTRLGIFPEFADFGSGIGIDYAGSGRDVDIEKLGAAFTQMHKKYREKNPGLFGGMRIIIETGRYLVCENGWYAARINDIKESRGKTFVMLNGTLNAFIRPALARFAEGIAPEPHMAEPLYTGKDSFPVIPLYESGEKRTVTLCGNLCTATDIIFDSVEIPEPECGKFIALGNAGAYAFALSPVGFASLPAPEEFVI